MNSRELFALPRDAAGVDRWLFDGDLVERWNGNGFHTPGHSATVVTVSSLLSEWCRVNGDYRAFGYGCPYLLARDPDTVLSFDASIVRRSQVASLRPDAAYLDCVPALAVEVVELDEDPDLLTRLVELSLRHGVRAVWVVDPVEPSLVVHRRERSPEYLNGGMILTGDPDLPGFSCAVADIFE